LLDRPHCSRICIKGRWISFPIKLKDLVLTMPKSFLFGIALDGLRHLVMPPTHDKLTLATLLERDLGGTICHEFYYPFARKVWGLPADELTVPQADRQTSGSLLGKMLKNAMGALPRRKPVTASRYLYARRGFGQIGERYSEAARLGGAEFVLGARVTGIERDGRDVKAVRYEHAGAEQVILTENVWSTLPLTLLVRTMRPDAPSEILEAASALSFRSMILIYLVIGQDQFTPYDCHFFPDPAIPITRLSEPKNYRGATEPRGRTVLCAELPCCPDSPEWTMSDEELGQYLCRSLERAKLPVVAPIQQVLTRRLKVAYPVYRDGSEKNLLKIDQWLRGFNGLISFGLQGLFAHDDSHHVLSMAYAAVECFGPDGRFDSDRWRSFRELFETRVAKFLRSMNAIPL
jgi:protoporphyrinogen oxidase